MKTIPLLLIVAAMLFVAAPTAGASPGALHVLIAYSDGGHTESNLKDAVAAQPGVAAVDTVNAGATTPAPQALSAYDLVVTFSNTDYANSATLGDNLANSAEQGHVVVEFDFNWLNRAQNRLGGRWASGGFSAYDGPATTVIQNGATFGPHEASSPLLAGVNSLGTAIHQDVAVAPRAVEVAKWSDGQSAVAFKGNAIGVNACVADGCQDFSGDFAKLIANAARTRAVGQLPKPDRMCDAGTFIQESVGSGNSYSVPLAGGVITSWYVQDGVPLAQDVRLEVGREKGADAVTLLGEASAGPRTAGRLDGPFPARIAVDSGDIIGLSTAGSGACGRTTGSAADTSLFATGTPGPDGAVQVSRAHGVVYPVEAIVEPDGDSDGFGDLTQDRCPGVAGSVDGCRSADLAVSVVASSPSIGLGATVIYNATVTNNGPDPAPDVVLTNTLPGGAPTASSLGTLASGQTASTSFAVKPAVAGPASDSATVASGAGDPSAADNSASASVSVIAPSPVLSHLTQTHRRWRRSGGTTFKFLLDKPAPVVLRFTQHGKARGTLRIQGHAGTNQVRFRGRLTKTSRLRPGTYAVLAAAGRSRSKTLRFTIVR